MPTHAADTVSTILPCLSYRDAHAAIEWLCRAFGFTKHAVYAEGDVVHHAELAFGNGMVMLGSVAKPGPWSQYTAHPDEIGGRATQSAYVIVSNCKAHYERAKAAGALIVLDYEEKNYGGAGYSCRDLEGHLWSFGSYDPWRAQTGS